MPDGSGLGVLHVDVQRVATRLAWSVAACAVDGATTVTAPPVNAHTATTRNDADTIIYGAPVAHS